MNVQVPISANPPHPRYFKIRTQIFMIKRIGADEFICSPQHKSASSDLSAFH